MNSENKKVSNNCAQILKKQTLGCFFFFILCFNLSVKAQSLIPSTYFGVNGWMTAYIGGVNFNGKLDQIWSPASNCIKDLNLKLVRYGGNANDQNFPTYTNTLTSECAIFINKARQNGMEPIIQIPFLYMLIAQYPNAALSLSTAISNATANATYTAAVVNFVTALTTTYNIKYFSISNEPDIWANTTPTTNTVPSATTAIEIAMYFRPISQWIKQVNPNAIVVGPDLASAQSWSTGLMHGLIDKNANLGAGDITGTITANGKNWCDIISFHTYPYGVSTTARSAVVAQPSGAFATQLNDLRVLMADQTKNANPNLKIAVTEFNITYENTVGSNTINDAGANSFIAGQWMAEIFARGLSTPTGSAQVAFMLPWSVHESSGNASDGDLGILNGTNTLTPEGRSTYYHIKMMAEGFTRGKFTMGTTTHTNVKVFSSTDCNYFTIMLMNQDQSAKTLAINYNNTYLGSASPTVDVKLNLSISKTLNITVGAEETVMLMYDACGILKKKHVYNVTTNSTYAAPAITTYTANKFCRCMKKTAADVPSYSLRCADPNETGSAHYNSVTLTSNTTLSDSAYITGTLTVPDRITLTIDTAEVVFAAEAKILVQQGGKVIIRQSYLHGCASGTWAGMEINGNNTASQFTMTNSYIENAVVAVKADQTNSPEISGNVFNQGNQGIRLNKVQGFSISENEFTNVLNCIKTSSCISASSRFRENLFYKADTSIIFIDDTHDQLDISCNGFVDYSVYGIYSTGSSLKNQGTSTTGAGNQFMTSSQETITNHQLYFTGRTAMTYYYDPSHKIDLLTDETYLATATEATNDETCSSISGRLANLGIDPESVGVNGTIRNSQLLNCRPNPASGKTAFTYNIADNAASAEIKIINLFGEAISTLPIAIDSHSTEINVSGLLNGIYFYTLVVDGNIIGSKKLIISK